MRTARPLWLLRWLFLSNTVLRIDRKSMKRFVGREVLSKVIPRELLTRDTQILINPSGAFVLGGAAADTGLTGRKLAVDQYGTAAHIGGGAFSGKDATKVDRSGAYVSRWITKNVVAAGMAKRCEGRSPMPLEGVNPSA